MTLDACTVEGTYAITGGTTLVGRNDFTSTSTVASVGASLYIEGTATFQTVIGTGITELDSLTLGGALDLGSNAFTVANVDIQGAR